MIDQRIRMLTAWFERNVGRPATPDERAGISRAEQDGTITAHLALGLIAGVNRDWPEPHQRVALEEYGLGAFDPTKEAVR
jgi:hypothetical protein